MQHGVMHQVRHAKQSNGQQSVHNALRVSVWAVAVSLPCAVCRQLPLLSAASQLTGAT